MVEPRNVRRFGGPQTAGAASHRLPWGLPSSLEMKAIHAPSGESRGVRQTSKARGQARGRSAGRCRDGPEIVFAHENDAVARDGRVTIIALVHGKAPVSEGALPPLWPRVTAVAIGVLQPP